MKTNEIYNAIAIGLEIVECNTTKMLKNRNIRTIAFDTFNLLKRKLCKRGEALLTGKNTYFIAVNRTKACRFISKSPRPMKNYSKFTNNISPSPFTWSRFFRQLFFTFKIAMIWGNFSSVIIAGKTTDIITAKTTHKSDLTNFAIQSS